MLNLPSRGAIGPPDTVRDADARVLTVRAVWPREAGHALFSARSPLGVDVAGQWFADHDRAQAHRTRLGSSSGSPDAGIVLHPAGVDDRLPGLAPLLRRPGATLVAHRAGRRAVVRLAGGAGPDGGETRFVKVVRPGRVDDVVSALRRASSIEHPDLRVPALVDCDQEAGTVTTSALPGATLHDLGASTVAHGPIDVPVDSPAGDRIVAAWCAAGAATAALHGFSVSDASIPSHGGAAESALTAAAVERATGDGALPEGVAAQIAPWLRALADHAPGPIGWVHRDLHDKQILADLSASPTSSAAVGVLDLDTSARGECALDIANLMVHLELRVDQGLLPLHLARRSAAAFLAGYRGATDEARCHEVFARCAVHARVTRARLAAVYATRPPWRHVVAAQLDRGSRGVPPLGLHLTD